MPAKLTRRTRFCSGLILGVALFMAGSLPASGAVSCYWFDAPGDFPPVINVSYSATGDEVRIVRSVDLIHVNGGPCSDGTTNGTVTNTQNVNISTFDDPAVDDMQAVISFEGGEFEPGFDTATDGNQNEVQFHLAADPPRYPSSGDVLRIIGASGAEHFEFGRFSDGSSHYINFDVDEVVEASSSLDFTDSVFNADTNEVYPTLDRFVFLAGGGADTVTGQGGSDTGGSGTGIAVTVPMTLIGRNGNDAFVGGQGRDLMKGGDGGDEFRGRAGNDALTGGPGRDLLVGGPGTDTCVGGPGNDVIRSCES